MQQSPPPMMQPAAPETPEPASPASTAPLNRSHDATSLSDEALSPRSQLNKEVERMLIDTADLPDIPDPTKIPLLPKFRRPNISLPLKRGSVIWVRPKAERH